MEWKSDEAADAGWNNLGGSAEPLTDQNTGFDADHTAADNGCRICASISHFARDCPEKADRPAGGCFNCGQDGHNKADCPEPRVDRPFEGTCRVCEEPGHRAKDCPQAPPPMCNACKQEGHLAADCSINRMQGYFRNLNIADDDAKDAYERLLEVGKAADFDLDDAKQAIFAYAKAAPDATWAEIEECCRENELKIFLIAKTQEVADTHTIIDLQGTGDREYVVTFQVSAKPRRAKFAEGWPTTPEENITRLANAGLPMDRLVPKCGNCGELGHTARKCSQDKVEREARIDKCANCDMDGHRARDCKEPRRSGNRACKNCGQEGHISKECQEPPNLDNVECKNCSQMGHFAKDCPSREPDVCRNCQEEGHRAKDCTNERVVKCRNCDGLGHSSRECDQPRDMSRVQCHNCDEMGHESRSCPKPRDMSRVQCTTCHEMGHSKARCTMSADDALGGQGEGWGASAAVAQTAGA